MNDFTPTKETISLHGLGFIQIILPSNQRMHVWHPELPRRDCFEFSAIHNHRFAFMSCILKGTQKNQRCEIELVNEGTHNVISHNGPRSEKGNRISQPVAQCNVHRKKPETYEAGQSYSMAINEYHETAPSGIVVTLMTKLEVGSIHANSICAKSADFHYDFDRFQLSPGRLYEYVVDALKA